MIKNIAQGRDFKTMAYRGIWRTDRGNHQVIRAGRALGYIGGEKRGENAKDLYHLTPYSKFKENYFYPCGSTEDILPPGVKCTAKVGEARTYARKPQLYPTAFAHVATHHRERVVRLTRVALPI